LVPEDAHAKLVRQPPEMTVCRKFRGTQIRSSCEPKADSSFTLLVLGRALTPPARGATAGSHYAYREYLGAIQCSETSLILSANSNTYDVGSDAFCWISLQGSAARVRDPHWSHFHVPIDDPDNITERIIAVFDGRISTLSSREKKVLRDVFSHG